jgi:RimJ/RimL family protein N-acetyltransferase
MADAEEVFACITPAVARFMSWEPPKSLIEYKARREARLQAADPTELTFVIRRNDTKECLGIVGLEGADQPSPKLGIWMKEAAHGQGYGGEAVTAVPEWATKDLAKETFLLPRSNRKQRQQAHRREASWRNHRDTKESQV